MKLLTASSKINLRQEFGKLDPLALITPTDVAFLISAPSVQSVYSAVERGALPVPIIRKNRQLRWTVGQIRDHLQEMLCKLQVDLAREVAGKGLADHGQDVLSEQRIGRPRSALDRGPI